MVAIPGLSFTSARASSSASLNSVIAPSFNISTAGPASGSAGGTASGSATSDASGSDRAELPGFLPTGGFGPALPPPSFDIDGPPVAASAGLASGLFDNPVLLVILAGGAFLLFGGGK